MKLQNPPSHILRHYSADNTLLESR
jgi:hypothetical protein